MKKLVASINKHLGQEALSERLLSTAFTGGWKTFGPKLKEAVKKAQARGKTYTYDVFLSAPMAAYTADKDYRAARRKVKKVFDALTLGCGLKVFWAAEKIESLDDFDTYDISVADDLLALEGSRYFTLLYPEKMATSSLFEAGYALALRRPSRYFAPSPEILPYLMRALGGQGQKVWIHTHPEWKDYDDLVKKMKTNHKKWFPPDL